MSTMKLLLIIYDGGIDDDVMSIVEELAPAGHTKLFGAHGFGGTGRKEATPVWPGSNNLLLVAVTPDQAAALVRALRELQATFHRKPGITVFGLEAEEL